MSNIKVIIKEEVEKIIKEQGEISPLGDGGSLKSQDPKTTAIQTINKHIRLLKFMKEALKNIKMPDEFQKMADIIKQNDTTKYISDFLQVKDDVPVKIEAILTNPIALIGAVIDHITNEALKNAKKKLQENVGNIEEDDIKIPRDYVAKHNKKLKQKGKLPPPQPVLEKKEKNDEEEWTEEDERDYQEQKRIKKIKQEEKWRKEFEQEEQEEKNKKLKQKGKLPPPQPVLEKKDE